MFSDFFIKTSILHFLLYYYLSLQKQILLAQNSAS